MNRSRRALAGGAVLALQVVLRVGTTIVLAPLLLHLENQETLGAYSVVTQLIGYVVLLELGLGRALGREVAQLSGAGGGEKAMAGAIGTSILFLSAVGVIAALLTATLAQVLPLWLTAADEVVSSARSAVLIFSAWMLLRFPLSVFQVLLFARQEIALYGGIALSGDLLRAILSIALVLGGYGLIGLTAGMVVSEGVMSVASWAISWRRRLIPSKLSFDAAILSRLLGIGIPLSLMSVGDQLTFFSQDLMAGWLMGATGAAVIYAMRMPAYTAASLVSRAIESAVPGLNELYGHRDVYALRSTYYRLAGYTLGAAAWLAAGICAFNRPIVEAWLGADLYETGGITAAIAFFWLVAMLNTVLTHFLAVEGRLTRYPAVVLFAGAVTVLLGLALGQYFGLAGVAWGAGLATLITTPFLLRRNARMLEVGVRTALLAIAYRGLRCSSAGVAICGAYALVIWLGLAVPWMVGLTIALVGGVAGFVAYGLVPQDRSTLVGWVTRVAQTTR
jgi:O-antigen/teichoic acid export membrane protein